MFLHLAILNIAHACFIYAIRITPVPTITDPPIQSAEPECKIIR